MKKRSAAGNGEGGRLFNFRPALFAAAFFACGIAFAYGRMFYEVSLWWLLAAAAVPFLAIAFFPGRPRRALLAAAMLLACFSAGAFAFFSEISRFSDAERISGKHTVVGTVEEKVDYAWSSRLLLSSLTVDGKRTEGRLVATLSPSSAENIRLADRISLYGETETDLSLAGRYGFAAENAEKGIRYRARPDAVSVIGREKDVFLQIRARLKDRLYAGMDDESAAMTYALLIGDTAGIEAGLYENIRYGGISHIFSVSGLNVGALYAVMLAIGKRRPFCRLPAAVRFFPTAGLLVTYAGVCGFSPSVLRAVVMCLVSSLSSLVGVKADMLENTGVAALVLLAVHPVRLFDAGFGLSFAACLGIGVFARTFSAAAGRVLFVGPRNREHPEGVFLRMRRAASEFVGVSLAAQVGTAPLLAANFGYLSLWSLALNCFFVPLTEALFFALLALAFAVLLLPAFAAPVLLYVPSVIWSGAMLFFHAVDCSLVAEMPKSAGAAVLFLCFFVLCSEKIRMGKGVRALLCAVTAAAFAAAAAGVV